MKTFNTYNNKLVNGIKTDMMGNYHGGCRKSCCKNSWGYPTKKGINNNCIIAQQHELFNECGFQYKPGV